MAKGKRKGTNQELPSLYLEVKDAPKDTGSMIDGRRSSPPGRRNSWYNRRLFFNPRRRSRPYTPGSVHPASASRAFPSLHSKRPPHSGGGVPAPHALTSAAREYAVSRSVRVGGFPGVQSKGYAGGEGCDEACQGGRLFLVRA